VKDRYRWLIIIAYFTLAFTTAGFVDRLHR
jgi:hypothetical protein